MTFTINPENVDRTNLTWNPEKNADAINPSHYQSDRMECIEWMETMLKDDEMIGYLKGNILKYLWRYKEKNGIEDLEKARWYINKLIDFEDQEDE